MTRSPKRERVYAALERAGVKVVRAEDCEGPYCGATLTSVTVDECPDGMLLTRIPGGSVTWAADMGKPRPALEGITKREVDRILGKPKKPRRKR